MKGYWNILDKLLGFLRVIVIEVVVREYLKMEIFFFRRKFLYDVSIYFKEYIEDF